MATTRPWEPSQFYDEALKANGIDHAFGVPDSSLSGLLYFFSCTKPAPEHIVAANEGGAVALAAGYHLATRKVALVYMQNSGLSNALNPLQSLAAKEVFGIPMLLMIGWRGRPGEKDEPQHALIGPRILENLKANDFPYEIMPESLEEAQAAIGRLVARALKDQTPVALVTPQKYFKKYTGQPAQEATLKITPSNVKAVRWMTTTDTLPLSRETAIRCVMEQIKDTDISVSSLGGNSREFYMVRKEKGQSLARNFFCIGGMGHSFGVTFGLTMGFKPNQDGRRVYCIEGDGSFLMHVGNYAVLAGIAPPHLTHIVIYNGVHSSTGSQALMIKRDNLLSLAQGLPYEQKYFVDTPEALKKACQAADRSTLIVVAVNEHVSDNLPRPSETSKELKEMFMTSFD